MIYPDFRPRDLVTRIWLWPCPRLNSSGIACRSYWVDPLHRTAHCMLERLRSIVNHIRTKPNHRVSFTRINGLAAAKADVWHHLRSKDTARR